MNKKILFSLSPLTLAAPIATLSCVNPFEDNEIIAKARFQNSNNNIFNNKTYNDFITLLDQSNIYQTAPAEQYAHVKTVFSNVFKNLNSVRYLTLEQFNEAWNISNLNINNTFVTRDAQGKFNRQSVVIKKEALALFVEYLFSSSPYAYNLLNKVWGDSSQASDEKLFYKDMQGSQATKSVKNAFSPADVNVNTELIIANEYSNLFFNEAFKKQANLETFKQAYRNIISVANKVIAKLADAEQSTLSALAPIYYVLQNPTFNEYINQNYATDKSGKFAMFKASAFKQLEAVKERIYAFAANPSEYYQAKKASQLINTVFINRHEETFNQRVAQYNKGIGKYGLSELVAFALYSINPANIQILAFDKAGTKEYLIQFKHGANTYLFNPAADFKNANENQISLYTTKAELNAAGYTLVDDLFGSTYANSIWK
ncbi:hypothetical protein [Mycoplasma simbae]|uniref:hypothetical protein n=1 Tax=Mycoplasma simbae TaxID=36744 RepID=UPI000495057C|nr:hypothetical protein [Mycoplasma simbae]